MRYYLLIVLITTSIQLAASEFATLFPGESGYKSYNINRNTQLIFHEQDSSAAFKLNSITPKILSNYQHSFGYSLDTPLYITLAATKYQQIMNGFSTQSPFNMTVFYNGGGYNPDYFATLSWLSTLSTHELAHNFQLNAKTNHWSQLNHSLFGNSFIIFPIIPIFIYPNLFLPSYILEGNSVVNESRFNNGGRLYSGAMRAITFAYLKHKTLYAADIFNYQDDINFPFGNRSYIISAYFHAYLAERFGIDKLNHFFYYNAQKPYNILSLDDTYQKTFHKTYEQLFFDFNRHYLPIMAKQKELYGQIICQDFSSSSIHKIKKFKNKIYFVSQNYSGPQLLHIFDITTQKLTHQPFNDWPAGSPIILQNKLYSMSMQQTNYNHYQIGLFDNHQQLLPQTAGKAIFDQHKNNILYVDLNKSYSQPHLFINKRFISIAHSSAIFDNKGNVYYFKNNGITRTLYKNNTALFSYKGYWGFPIDQLANKLYFIAPTKYGSSIFSYSFKTKQLWRESPADNILDAKMISTHHFIASTVNSRSFAFQLGKTNPTKQSPILYKYKFHQLQKNSVLTSSPFTRSTNQYTAFTNMHFSNIDLQMSYSYSDDQAKLYTSTAINFSDPLQQNSLSLGLHYDSDLTLANIYYANTQSKLHSYINGIKVIRNEEDFSFYLDSPTGYGASLKLELPLTFQTRKKSFLGFLTYTDYDDKHKNPLTLFYRYSYQQSNGHASTPLINFSTLLFTQYDHRGFYDIPNNQNLWMNGITVALGKSINEFYSSIKLRYTKANKGNTILISDSYSPYQDPALFTFFRLPINYTANEISGGTISFSQMLHFDLYHHWIPFSIRREAIFLELTNLQLHYTDKTNPQSKIQAVLRPDNILEIRSGLDIDLLTMHKFPLNLRLQYSYSNADTPESSFTIIFNSNL